MKEELKDELVAKKVLRVGQGDISQGSFYVAADSANRVRLSSEAAWRFPL